jgi:pimeloyl-ACP methyl ester carboxylesterase
LSLIQTNCPVLLLFGDLDVIHPPDKHLEIMERALKKVEIITSVLKSLLRQIINLQ